MKEHAGEGRGGLIAPHSYSYSGAEATTEAFCLTEAAAGHKYHGSGTFAPLICV